ncbi:MAG: SDR family oxidoreductase [Myxococcales bacterium]|nr:SDR family oxidoreductase [Myxococcales bacterium]
MAREIWDKPDLSGRVALVAGATRGAGRGIAVELGACGATVYCTGRSTRGAPSDMARAETIDETAERVTAAGGRGIPERVDHTRADEVEALFARVRAAGDGALDVLVIDIWGGDPLTEWGKPFWELDPARGQRLLERAVTAHILTARYGAPLMVGRGSGLIIEVTDGDREDDYRQNLYYDLAKNNARRLGWAMAQELTPRGVTALSLTPGFLRSEAMLDHFGVTEETWREAIAQDRYFESSETPTFIGRAVCSLAGDPEVASKAGQALATWHLAEEYGFTDGDGRRPHWQRFLQARQAEEGAKPDP